MHFSPIVLIKVNSEISSIHLSGFKTIRFISHSLPVQGCQAAGITLAAVNQDLGFWHFEGWNLQMSRPYKVIEDRNHVQRLWGRLSYIHPMVERTSNIHCLEFSLSGIATPNPKWAGTHSLAGWGVDIQACHTWFYT